MKRRAQTSTERDLSGLARRRAEAAPEFVCEDITGQYEGDALRTERSKRPTDKRIARLEEKHDLLVKTVGETREDVAGMRGELRAFLVVVESERKAAHQTERVRITSRARIIVGIVGAIGVAIGAVITAMAGCA